MASSPKDKPPPLAGNRIALAGAIWYLLEIPILFPFVSATSPSPAKGAALVAFYSGQKTNLLIGAAGASVILLGRIAFSAGARASLRRSPTVAALADLALGCMVLSVVMEIAMTMLFAAAGRMAADGGDVAAVAGVHYAAETIGFAVFAPLAVSVLATALAQVISEQFPRWLAWLGVVAGVLGIPGSLFAVVTAQNEVGSPAGFWIFGFWIWMIATGIVLFRRAGHKDDARAESPLVAGH